MPNYLNNKDFYNTIVEYKTTKSRESYEMLGKMFMLIAKNAINQTRFIKYSEDRKSEMISDAAYMLLKKVDQFNEEKYKNPFAYYTEMAKNAYKATADGYKRREKMFVNLSFIENFEKGD